LLTVIPRSNVRSAGSPSDPNLQLDPLDGKNSPASARAVKSVQEDNEDVNQVKPMICFDTADLRRTLLLEEDNDGLRSRARIIEVLDDRGKSVADNPVLKKFGCHVGEEEFEEILLHNKVMQHTEKDDDNG
jgi:hypothetical protein